MKYMKISKSIFISGIIVAIILLAIFAFNRTDNEPGEYDAFAKCLSDNEVKMYGAYWCPYCNDQKEMFGNSWKYINYIECSLPNRAGQKLICQQNNVKVYPTWEFQDGQKIEGKLSLEQLSQYGDCKLEGQI